MAFVVKWRARHFHASPLMEILCRRTNSLDLLFVLLSGWISLERLPKDPQHNHEKIFLRQGFHDLLERAFLEKISFDRILLNTIVQRIAIHEEEQYVHVEVLNKHDQQPTIYRAQHVVCTQSIGCLKQTMHQMFVPALPHAKRMCIQRLGFGTINKVCSGSTHRWGRLVISFQIYLVFSQPFWDVDFDAFHFLWDLNRLSTEWKLKCLAKTSFDVSRGIHSFMDDARQDLPSSRVDGVSALRVSLFIHVSRTSSPRRSVAKQRNTWKLFPTISSLSPSKSSSVSSIPTIQVPNQNNWFDPVGSATRSPVVRIRSLSSVQVFMISSN